MNRVLLVLISVAVPLCAERVRILRDDYGVPHIFAKTPAGVSYGAGYAQAEDRLEEMMRNFRKAEGAMAEAFGESWLQHDYRQRLWRHAEVARANYGSLGPEARAMCEAFMAGVGRYVKDHPRELPEWAPALEPWRLVALGRYIISGWHEGEVGGDLMRAGIRPDPPAYRGSNQWLLAPSRTAMRTPIALIDPHLSWYGEFRFYEMRVYAGDHALSGAAIVGLPFPSLGHNRYLSIAMTTGGPDTSDVFEEEVKEGKYRFKDEWRPLETRRERIGVNTGDKVEWKEFTIESTHHGPIVAHKDGKAYSAAVPYANEFRLIEQSWRMGTARNLAEMKKALAQLQLMQQNVMVGTVDGDIYYLRNGRVPVRPAGCNPSRPMPGTGACEWQGIHPFEDLLQVTNPPQGYLQNCNISPQWLTKTASLFPPEKYKDRFYLYNATPGPPHQRAAMVLDLLDAAKNVTVEQAIEIAFSPLVHRAESWQERIRKLVPEPSPYVNTILEWNRRSDADSRGALAFFLFKVSLPVPRRGDVDPERVSDTEMLEALKKGEQEVPPGATYGTVFRAGRQGGSETYPVAGGTVPFAGMSTPRAITFQRDGKQFLGRGGQTATQIVVLSKPPKSWMVLPLGNSDHKESGHWDDQLARLFHKSQMKPTWFLQPRELKKHVKRTVELDFQ